MGNDLKTATCESISLMSLTSDPLAYCPASELPTALDSDNGGTLFERERPSANALVFPYCTTP